MNPVQEAILAHQGRMGGDGTCVQWCQDDILSSPSAEFDEYIVEQSAKAVVKKEWAALNSKNKSKSLSGQQHLNLGGLPCAGSYAYRDEFIPGGYRTVLTMFMSVYQLIQARNDHAVQKRAFDESDAAFGLLCDKAIELADGDLNKSIFSLSDDFSSDVA